MNAAVKCAKSTVLGKTDDYRNLQRPPSPNKDMHSYGDRQNPQGVKL